jgi:hypothetical protein
LRWEPRVNAIWMCAPLGSPWATPSLRPDRDLIRFANSPLLCGTGDSFAASRPELPCDLVDMELYAVAKVCRSERTPLRTFKYISDQADHAAPQDWRLALNHAALAFSARVQQGI